MFQNGALLPDVPAVPTNSVWKLLSRISCPTVYEVEGNQGVSLKLKMHPPEAHAEETPPVSALANIHSVAPPVAFGFKTSVTGEQGVPAVVERTGPGLTFPRTPSPMATWYRIGFPPVFPQT
jgi:hypothetical protein